MKAVARFTWRKLSAAKADDAWWERLSWMSDRLCITSRPGRSTIRVQAFDLSRAEAERLRRAHGGQVRTQPQANPAFEQRRRPPVRIRGKLRIVGDSRECEQFPQSRARILVIPGSRAFGTGDHATTASCLRLLADVSDELRQGSWKVLDIGTGTGILAIAACMLGARAALGTDTDPVCVRIARQNVRENGLKNVRIRKVDVRTWRADSTWEVVTANLYSGILVEAARRIAAATAPDGRVIFSGVLCPQEDEVSRAFAAAGLRIERIVRKNKWVAGIARRDE